MPSAITSTVSVNSSRDCVARHARQQPGNRPRRRRRAANAAERGDLREREHDGQRSADRPRRLRRRTAPAAARARRTVNRSSTTSQPTATWPAGVCSCRLSDSTRISTTVLATDSAMPKTMPRGQVPAERMRDHRAERRRDHALHDRAGDGDAPDGQQIVEVEVQPDAEHQQDDADLGELLGEVRDRRRSPACTGRRRCRPAGSRRSATAGAAACR